MFYLLHVLTMYNSRFHYGIFIHLQNIFQIFSPYHLSCLPPNDPLSSHGNTCSICMSLSVCMGSTEFYQGSLQEHG